MLGAGAATAAVATLPLTVPPPLACSQEVTVAVKPAMLFLLYCVASKDPGCALNRREAEAEATRAWTRSGLC